MKGQKKELVSDQSKTQARNYFLLIFALTFLLYGNSIKNNYALDDNYVTVTEIKSQGNARVAKGIKGIPEIFSTHYVQSKEQNFEYRPLPLVTFAIEYQLFGSNPHVSHLISIIIYGFTCILLFSILCRLFKTYHIVFPLLVTLLFLAHPIHTEVVCNIKCRDELMSFFFSLLSLHFLLKRIDNNKWIYVLWSALFLLMAILCKKTAVLFAVIIPLTIYFFTGVKWKKIVLQGLVLLSMFLVFNLMRRILLPDLNETREFVFFENPLFYEDSLLQRLPTAIYTLGYYLKLFFLPYPLCSYYGYDVIPIGTWSSPFVLISLVLYGGMGVYALLKFSKKSILSYSILVFFAGTFLFSNLITPVAGIVAERLVYVASFGFSIALAYLLLVFFKVDYTSYMLTLKGSGASFKRVAVIILIVFSVLVISRNNQWKDELTLFRSDSEHFENSCNLHYLLGTKLYAQVINGQAGSKREAMVKEATFNYQEALRLMKSGIEKYPQDFTTMSNIGSIYVNVFNDAASAQPYFKKSLTVKPDNEIAQYNFAFCYEKRNLPDSAILYYEKMTAGKDVYPPVYLQLRELYLKKNDFEKAVVCDRKSIKLSPNEARLYINLGNDLINCKDTAGAIKQFEKAVELEPQNTPLKEQVDSFLKKRAK